MSCITCHVILAVTSKITPSELFTASYPKVSLSRWKCAHRGWREAQNGRDGTSPLFLSFSWSLALCHQLHPFCARLCAKNKASEEEEAALFMWNSASGSLSFHIQSPTFGQATRERLAKGDARVRGFARGFVANSRVLSLPSSLSKKSGDISL